MSEVPILEAAETVEEPQLPNLQTTIVTRSSKKYALLPGTVMIDGPWVQGFIAPGKFVSVPVTNVDHLLSVEAVEADGS